MAHKKGVGSSRNGRDSNAQRLGVKFGADPKTFMGLTGMGDLVLTFTDNQSRNRRFGFNNAR